MNHTELTPEQLAEVAAAGLFINTNGSASYEETLSSLLFESFTTGAGGDSFDLTQKTRPLTLLETKRYEQTAIFEMEQGIAKAATLNMRSLSKRIG